MLPAFVALLLTALFYAIAGSTVFLLINNSPGFCLTTWGIIFLTTAPFAYMVGDHAYYVRSFSEALITLIIIACHSLAFFIFLRQDPWNWFHPKKSTP